MLKILNSGQVYSKNINNQNKVYFSGKKQLTRDVFMQKKSESVNIKLRASYPGNVLSNLFPVNFVFDGVQINSIEGFLQSLKVKNVDYQKKICAMDGLEAKKISKGFVRDKGEEILYWQGKMFRKDSKEFELLLNEINNARKENGNGVFSYQGIEIKTMQNLIKSLRVRDDAIQRLVCKSDLRDCNEILSEFKPLYDERTLYWKGKPIKRNSKEYEKLLDKVYFARYMNDPTFRSALNATKGKKLIHSIGKANPEETILTEQEFIHQLEKLRDNKLDNFILGILYKIKNMK